MATVPKNMAYNEENSRTNNPNQTKRRSLTFEDIHDLKSGQNNQHFHRSASSMEAKPASSSENGGSSRVSSLIQKIQKPFKRGGSNPLEKDWMLVDTDAKEMVSLQETVVACEKSFVFTKTTTHKTLSQSIFNRCRNMIARMERLDEKLQMIFTQCENEMNTLQSYLGKLRSCILPPVKPRETEEEIRNLRQIEWAVSRMNQIIQSLNQDMQENATELDALNNVCGSLLVNVITLLHMRSQIADYSGTGVAAGAASVVAGAVITGAGILAAPATAGLSIPILFAGKSLLVSGAVALTPASVMLNRHNQQLNFLASLVCCLKSRSEIMAQKREILVYALNACSIAELNLQQAAFFCLDATELERSTYENSGSFIDAVGHSLNSLESTYKFFISDPPKFHFCSLEDSGNQLFFQYEDE